MAAPQAQPQAPATASRDTGADDLAALAADLLQRLQRRGFDAVQVGAARTRRLELNLVHNEASLMRGGTTLEWSVSAIAGGRRAAAEGTDTSAGALDRVADELWAAAASAPVDEAHAVSAGQVARIDRGPAEADPAALAAALKHLLDWRARHTPSVMIEEAQATQLQRHSHTLTSAGSRIEARLGWLDLSVFGLARDGARTSSFNWAGGRTESAAGLMPADGGLPFGLAPMMRGLVQHLDARPLGRRFTGEVVLAPGAVADLLAWFMDQLGDAPLIDGSSLYRHQVGRPVASSCLTLRSRAAAPGCLPVTADACLAPPATLVDAGRLTQLAPSLYGARKTGLPHRPVPAEGWELLPGDTPREALIAAVPQGALVERLSMGEPAPNGDFAGVIKNSFGIDQGRLGAPLAETMISGNVARMLQQVLAVSRERLDSGALALPWLRIGGLHFS